nr:DNA-directed RNA polymerase II subunit RPB1-like [Aedes albopictus]
MMYFKLTAIVLLSVGVLAAKDAQPKSGTSAASASAKPKSKIPHGKREAPVGYGPMEYLNSGHTGYNYGVAQPSFNLPQYTGQKYYMAPFKYPTTQPAYFSPATHGYNSFADNSVKYSIGSKELSDLLKALQSPSPSISIKAIPSGNGWDAPYSYDSFSQFKPTMIKVQEVPSHSYGAPLAPPVSSYYSHGYAAPHQSEPTYASGVKGLRHYSSSYNQALPDLYSGNKYISSIKPLTVQTPVQVLSPLHTSIHTQKPFKPSTYLGTTNDTPDYSHTQAPTSTSVHNSYLAPSLQYLPPKAQNKVTFEQPSKTYLPSLPSSPSNTYLPPKPSNTYLPAAPSSTNYIPVSSHSDNSKHLQHLHHQHSSDESNDSYEYSGTAGGSVSSGSTVKPHHHPWQP